MILHFQKKPVTKQLIDIYEKHKPAAILAVHEVPDEDLHKYGTIKYKKKPEIEYEMEMGYEKVPKEQAPSNMAQDGRFVLSYETIKKAQKTPLGINNELWLIDILNELVKDGQKVIAQPIEGEWVTTGDPEAFLQTTVKFVLMRDDLRGGFLKFLGKELKKNQITSLLNNGDK